MELPLWVEWMALKMLTPGLLGMWGVITEWRTSNKTISKADNSAENCPEGWRCTPWRHLYFLSQQGKMLQILANGTFLLLVFSFCSQTHLRSAQGRTYCGTLGLQNPPLCWSHHCSPLHPPTRATLSSSVSTFQTLWVTDRQTRLSFQDPYSDYLVPVIVYQWHMQMHDICMLH